MMEPASDEVNARAWIEAILKDEPCDAMAMLDLLERRSMTWIVDVFRESHPNAMAISVPSLLAGFSLRENAKNEAEALAFQGLRNAISDYLR